MSYQQELSTDNYQALTDLQHVLRRPGMYTGSTKAIAGNYLLLGNDRRFYPTVTSIIPGLIKLVDELLYNASDAVMNAKPHGIDPGPIHCQLDGNSFTIRNGGLGIPVERKIEEATGQEKWIPEMIFGQLRTSSNYDNAEKHRTVVGQNGYGAKLSNIFSTCFQIEVADGLKNQQKLQTYWQQNMSVQGPVQIEPYQGPSYVQVTMYPDWRYFTDQHGQQISTWPESTLGSIGTIAANISYYTKTKIILNGSEIDFPSIEHYAAALFEPQFLQNHFSLNLKVKDGHFDLFFCDTPGDACTVSMVNGKETLEHGSHVKAVKDKLKDELIRIMNGKFGIKTEKPKKTKKPNNDKTKKAPEKDARTIDGRRLNVAYINANISVLVFFSTRNPDFSGQAKNTYQGPIPDFKLPSKQMEVMADWAALQAIRSFVLDIDRRLLSKSDGRKKANIRLGYGEEDANWAGKAKSYQCELSIVEGLSAKGYWTVANAFMFNARDTRGVLPGRGKLLNTYNANAESIANSKFIGMLKQMLGLREGLDYRIDENFRSLRYGKVIILNDADPDGGHITMLELTYFAKYFPSLFLRQDFFYLERTPVIRNQNQSFYTLPGYHQAQNGKKSKGLERYMKGLASSSKEDVGLDMEKRRLVRLIWDQQTPYFFQLAMDEKNANPRKQWLLMQREVPDLENAWEETISTYTHCEYYVYGQVCLPRAIPTMDGFNNARGKMIYYAFQRWDCTKEPTANTKPMKIAQLGNAICAAMGYHHGEKSMIDALVRMCQNYISCPNNQPLFEARSLVGTRNDRDQGDARYLFTCYSWAMTYLFPAADRPLLKRLRLKEEGEFIEPLSVLPIVPISLLNGANGVGVGWSTFIPSYNPLHVIEWYMQRLTKDLQQRVNLQPTQWPEPLNLEPKDLSIKGLPIAPNPWYRGFTGKVEVVFKNDQHEEVNFQGRVDLQHEELNVNNLNDDDDVGIPAKAHFQLVCSGIFEYDEVKKKVTVTEIPIGRYINQYREWLRQEREEKRIKDLVDHSDDNHAKFMFTWLQDKPPTLKNLHLIRRFGLSNMYLLRALNAKFTMDQLQAVSEDMEAELAAEDTGSLGVGKYQPVYFPTVLHLMEYFYHWRLTFYYYRKILSLNLLTAQIEDLTNLWKLIRASVFGPLQLTKRDAQGRSRPRTRKELETDIVDPQIVGVPAKYLDHRRYRVANLTEEEVSKLETEIKNLQAEWQQIQNTPHQTLWWQDLNAYRTRYLAKEAEMNGQKTKSKKGRKRK